MTRRAAPYLGLFAAAWAGVAALVLALGWQDGWGALFVHTLSHSFGDFRVLAGSVITDAQGLDPYVTNPGDPEGTLFNHPRIWIYLLAPFGLENEARFNAAGVAIAAGFLGSLGYLIWRFPSWALTLGAISGAVMMGVERGNADLIMFVMVFAAMAAKPDALKAGLIFIAAVLKLFPILALAAMVRPGADARAVIQGLVAPITVFAAFLLYLSATWPDVLMCFANMDSRGAMSYGVKIIAFLVHERLPQAAVSDVMIYLAFVALLIAQMALIKPQSALLRRRPIANAADGRFEESLFLGGAAIYVLSFLGGDGWDYRMAYCLMCAPLMLRTENAAVRWAFSISLLLGMNYFLLVGLGGVLGGAMNMLAKTALHVILSAGLITILLPRLAPLLSLFSAPGKSKQTA
ncbi:MAG: hypothetical protein GC189_05165 [Alphaproteobacteria bacterium]|nr:hypothetical protein [Alphaproteobacteria bacterium]